MALSTSSQALLWDAFRKDPSSDEDLYLPDSHIVFLPTGAGAAGEPQVREFFKAGGFSHAKKLAVEEKVIHRTVGESSAVDEVEVTVKFVSGAGGWLLPGIQPHHLEDLTITFPLMVCGSIVEDRIASVRYLWDNASVLKMVRLIGSRHSWPIVAETQVDALRSPSRFRLNPFGNATSGSGARAQISNISNIFSPPVSPPHVTAAQQQQQAMKKGHPALTSQIFSQQPHQQQQQQATSPVSAGQSGKKGHPALTSTLFDHLKSAPQEEQSQHQNNSRLPLSPSTSEESLASKASTPTSSHNYNHDNIVPAKKGHSALTSTLFNHLKDSQQQQQQQPAARATRQEPQQEVEEERAAGWRSDYVRPKGHPALTSTLFSQPPPPPNPALSRPYKKTSHNIFGPPPPVEKVAAVPVVAEEYVLEPSALEAELVRNEEQQQELKESIVSPLELTTEDLEKQVLELEKLKVQEELYQAQQLQQEQEAQKKVEEPVVEPTPVPTPAPAPAPARKIHPNYRSSFTIGGPR
ncbi:hypothetical protein BGX24_003875 [Mortierella sp. AD032]|nr:hypothetical protein BGX24_003875 [Mortierella sp. AD032]